MSRSRATALGMVALCVSAVGACGDDPAVPNPSTVRVRDLDVRPLVATPDESLTLSVELGGTTAGEVSFRAEGNEWILYDPPDRLLTAYDDGTHGDPVAGDRVFTVSGLKLPVGPAGIGSIGVDGLVGLHAPTRYPEDPFHVKMSFRSIDPAVVEQPEVVELGPDARATSRVVALTMPGRPKRSEVLTRYFELMPDDRDFLVIIRGRPSQATPAGRAWRTGTARPDLPELVVTLYREPFRSDYSDVSMCLLTHEFMHRWGVDLGPPLESETNPAHWGPALDRDTSAFGFAPNPCLMNDLELYLAGFLPPDSIMAPLTEDGYTIQALIQDQGSRVPLASYAERTITVGFVVVYDKRVRDHELAFFHHIVEGYSAEVSPLGETWVKVTGGRSVLDTRLVLP